MYKSFVSVFIKRIFVFVFMFVTISSFVYAFKFSFGINTLGVGPTFQRGKDYEDSIKEMKDNGITAIKNNGFNLNAIDLVFQFDFLKYFAIEFGAGFSVKQFGMNYTFLSDRYQSYIGAAFVSIPLMFKVQHEFFNVVNLYAGVGPRFNINAFAVMETFKNGKEISSVFLTDYEYNTFDMDINFSIGAEFKVLNFNYIGIRAGYNLNVLSLTQTDGKRDKYYVDSLVFHLTGRYLFNIKQ